MPLPAEPLIEIKHATLGYNRRPVLSHVNLAIEPGSFVGFFGHNGSGKTTILRTILGLIPVLKGELVLGGHGRGPRFGFVPQKERLDPIFPLSVFQVASLGVCRELSLRRWFKKKDEELRVKQALKDCGALELAPRLFSDLSGGQKQRVLIARALASDPKILALDEPLAGIDVTTQRALLKLLNAIKEERRLTVLMVSHRLEAERDLFTHIVWVEDGKAAIGKAGEVLAGGQIRQVFAAELSRHG